MNEELSSRETCRTTGCNNRVRIVGNKMNYYCNLHIRCGCDATVKGPCEGCLKTFQSDGELTDAENY